MQRKITTTGRVILGVTATWVGFWLLAALGDETTHLAEGSSLQQEFDSRGYKVTNEAHNYVELEHRNGATAQVQEGDITLFTEPRRLNGVHYTVIYSPSGETNSLEEVEELLDVAIEEKTEYVDGDTTGWMADSQDGLIKFILTEPDVD